MPKVRYQALGPLLASEGSRAILGLEIVDDKQTRPMVIMWLPEEVLGDSELLVRVTRETARAATLEHPNILRVIGLEKVDGRLARIVEFADGESLRLLLETVKMLPREVASYVVCNVAMGVHFAHVAGNDDGTPLLHGDLRPETVMITHAGLCKVTGYGALTVAPKEANGKRVRGRRLYAAPEQVLGGREALNRQTDVFLLGLMLYECLTGKLPFSDEPEPHEAILNKALPMEVDVIPEALGLVIGRATAKRAWDRYPTAMDLKDALERAQPPLPTPEAFAAYLATHFASSQEARSARAHEIESGVADVPPQPQVSPVRQDPAVPPASTPAPKGSAESPITAAPPASVPSGKERRVPGATVVALALAAAAVAVLWAGGDEIIGALGPSAVGNGDLSSKAASVAQPARAPPPVAPAPAESPTKAAAQLPAPGESPAKPTAQLPAPAESPAKPTAQLPAPAESPGKPTAQLPAIAPPSISSLELIVDPPVYVTVDGSPAGRSPLTLPLAAGRHKVQLIDRKKGINVTRNVDVPGKGRTRQQIVLGNGYVAVTAPPGALINIDGKTIGEAPVSSEISLFEGSHHILVTMGIAKWQQNFQVKADEHAYFNVEVRDQ